MSNALVVGHDRQAAGGAALQVAVDLARRLGAHLHVVHSITLDDYGIDPDSDSFEAEYERTRRAEHDDLDSELCTAGIEWTYHEQRDDPAHALARVAAELDALYIVVGATHAGGCATWSAASPSRGGCCATSSGPSSSFPSRLPGHRAGRGRSLRL